MDTEWTLEALTREGVLRAAFFECRRSDGFADGWTHVKTVPYAILAQADEGAYEITAGGETIRVAAPEAFLTGPQQPLRIVHHASPRGRMSARWVHFSFLLYETIDFLSLWEMPLRVPASAGIELGAIMAELLQPGAGFGPETARQAIRYHELSWSTLRLCCGLSAPRPDMFARMEGCRRLLPVLAHIRQNLGQRLEIRTLAQLAHLSSSRFFDYFREQLGIAPMAYIKRLRLNEAACQLTATEKPLKQIAGPAGFANPFHLSREFKRQFGLSPVQYRRQTRGGTGIVPTGAQAGPHPARRARRGTGDQSPDGSRVEFEKKK